MELIKMLFCLILSQQWLGILQLLTRSPCIWKFLHFLLLMLLYFLLVFELWEVSISRFLSEANLSFNSKIFMLVGILIADLFHECTSHWSWCKLTYCRPTESIRLILKLIVEIMPGTLLSYPYPYHAPVNPTNLVAG